MSWSGILSLFCIIVTGAVCTWAVFSKHYDDTALQRVGLSILAIACILRVPYKIQDPDTPPEILLGQFGVVIYAVGTVIKFVMASRGHVPSRRRRWSMEDDVHYGR